MFTVSGTDTLDGSFTQGLHVTGFSRITIRGHLDGLVRVDRGSTLLVQGNSQATLSTEKGSRVSLQGAVALPLASSIRGAVKLSGLVRISPGLNRLLPPGEVLIAEGTVFQLLGLGGGLYQLTEAGELKQILGQHAGVQIGAGCHRYFYHSNSFSPVELSP